MEEGLKIKIGADIVSVTKSLGQVEAQLKRFQSSLKTAADPISIERLNRAISRTQQYITGIKTAGLNNGLKGVAGSSTQASQALFNLGRVAQDAPYGFIGIANNLDPLLHSFQQLKKESGSVGGALKALGGSLLGANGLALGFSVVTSALVYFGLQANKAKRETKELKDEIRSIADIRDDSAGSVQGEIQQVQALTAAILDETRAKSERVKAIDQLKQVNKSYFGDLTLEASKLATLTQKVNDYTKALIQQAVVRGFEAEISKVAPELAKQERELANLTKGYVELENSAKAAIIASAPNASNFAGTNFGGTAQTIDRSGEQERLTEKINKVSELRNQFKFLSEEVVKATGEMLKFKPLESVGTESGNNKTVDILQQQIDKLEQLRNTVGLLKSEENFLLELKIQLVLRDQQKNDLNAGQLQRVIQELVKDADLESKPVIVPIIFQPKTTTIQGTGFEGIDRTVLAIKKAGEAAGEDKRLEEADQKAQKLATTLSSTLQPAFQAVFDSIGKGGQSILKTLTSIIGNIIKRLAAAALQAAVFAAIITAVSGGSFGAVFASKFGALSGLGDLIGSGKGGVANPGSPARGAALRMAREELVTRVSGNHLDLVLQRTWRSNNRLG